MRVCGRRPSSGGLGGGLFNVSLHAITDEHHRGNAYLGFLDTRRFDVATATPLVTEGATSCPRTEVRRQTSCRREAHASGWATEPAAWYAGSVKSCDGEKHVILYEPAAAPLLYYARRQNSFAEYSAEVSS